MSILEAPSALASLIESSPPLSKALTFIKSQPPPDTAHDLSHIARVLDNGWKIAKREPCRLEPLLAAILLHDSKNYPKGHPKAKSSSAASAEFAVAFLQEIGGFSEEELQIVHDAILCHSFSRGLTPKTIEGQILQDADRLDALGAVGIARLFQSSGFLGSSIYNPTDPLGKEQRELDDKRYALDHVRTKLFLLPGLMHTKTGRALAIQKMDTMRRYLQALEDEINPAMEELFLK
jgi:uncharacterized protein